MGQRHNRRRTRRPRSRNRNSVDVVPPLPPTSFPDTNYLPAADDGISPTSSPSLSPVSAFRECILEPSAPTWHNRFIAWQDREREQQQEADMIEAEQCRLFGGEPGDDVSLCYRMLEYFGQLDYIDT